MALDVKRSRNFDQIILNLYVLRHALLIIVHEEASFVILIVNLLEITVFATTRLLAFLRSSQVCIFISKVTVMTDEDRVSAEVLVGIEGI